MEPDVFALLLGFTLAKMGIAAGILWLGLRSPERPPGRDGDGPPGDGEPPVRPSGSRAARPERSRRGGPSRRATEPTRARGRRSPARGGGP